MGFNSFQDFLFSLNNFLIYTFLTHLKVCCSLCIFGTLLVLFVWLQNFCQNTQPIIQALEFGLIETQKAIKQQYLVSIYQYISFFFFLISKLLLHWLCRN